MNDTPVRTLTELRVATAYVKLASLPENSAEPSVSLASNGSYEIRMFRGPEVEFDGAALFWLELFDHSTSTSVDGFSCHSIRDAVPIFDDFIEQAARLTSPRSCGEEK